MSGSPVDPHGVSVVMSVYGGDAPGQVRDAFASLVAQTRQPNEIVLVVDGAVGGELATLLDECARHPLVRLVPLPENRGRGEARHKGISVARTPVVAIMDADDISVPRRLELQLEAMRESGADVVGGFIAEFERDPREPVRVRAVPLEHDDILSRGRWSQPFNHVTLMFTVQAYTRAGGYGAYKRVEDYDLFHRMVLTGARFRNLHHVLVLVRVGDAQYGRRRGRAYLDEERQLYAEMRQSGYLTRVEWFWNVAMRVVARSIPRWLLTTYTKRVMRSPVGATAAELSR